MTRLGIDLGDVRIGVAIGDELGLVASPFRVLKSRGWEHDIKEITAIARDTGAGEIVVGMPRNMDGTYGAAAQKVNMFCERLRQAVAIPVVTWDERLSSREAGRALLTADMSRKRRREVVDKSAAAIILQSYLDRHKSYD